MGEKNKLGTSTFMLLTLILTIIIQRAYMQSIAGILINYESYALMKIHLVVIYTPCYLISLHVTENNRRTVTNAFLNACIPAEVHFLFLVARGYIERDALLNVAIIAGIVLSIIYYVVYQRLADHMMKNPASRRRHQKQIAMGIRHIMALVLIIPVATYSYLSFTDNLPVKKIVREYEWANFDEEKTIEANIGVFRKWIEEDLPSMDEDEKMELLQKTLESEFNWLGIPNDVTLVISGSLDENVKGEYNSKNRTITINKDVFNNGSAEDLQEVLFHEIAHAYQEVLIRFYDTVDDQYKGLLLLKDIPAWKKDFEGPPIDAETNYPGYYYQFSEWDAREYSWKNMERWKECLERYLSMESTNDAE